MAGPVPAIHAFIRGPKNMDARDKPGHDGVWGGRTGSACAEASARKAISA
jgi:hypothetical protein